MSLDLATIAQIVLFVVACVAMYFFFLEDSL